MRENIRNTGRRIICLAYILECYIYFHLGLEALVKESDLWIYVFQVFHWWPLSHSHFFLSPLPWALGLCLLLYVTCVMIFTQQYIPMLLVHSPHPPIVSVWLCSSQRPMTYFCLYWITNLAEHKGFCSMIHCHKLYLPVTLLVMLLSLSPCGEWFCLFGNASVSWCNFFRCWMLWERLVGMIDI